MLKWQTGEPARIKKSTMAMAIVVLVLAGAAAQYFVPAASTNNQDIYIEHTVEPGETLWQIAQHYRPDVDPRQVVCQIKKASGCSALIRPGQVLLVPVGE